MSSRASNDVVRQIRDAHARLSGLAVVRNVRAEREELARLLAAQEAVERAQRSRIARRTSYNRPAPLEFGQGTAKRSKA